MIHLRQAVVVEGRYDKAKLASILDAVIIETGGFRIFKDKEKLAMLREIARRQGLSLTALIALNPQIKNPNLILVGEKVRVA